MYAAYDAGLDGADELTPRALRHTYLVYLLRQGIRFADIGRIVGRLPPQELAAYMRYAPSQPRLPLESRPAPARFARPREESDKPVSLLHLQSVFPLWLPADARQPEDR